MRFRCIHLLLFAVLAALVLPGCGGETPPSRDAASSADPDIETALRDMRKIETLITELSKGETIVRTKIHAPRAAQAGIALVDPWGNPYEIRRTDPWTRFEVASAGPPGGEELVVRPEVPDREAAIARSLKNMQSIVKLLRAYAEEHGWDALPYGGKAFVLAVVAHGLIDRDDADALAVLFSPGDRDRSVGAVDLADYARMTPKGLRAATEDPDRFTSYAGRRNAEHDYRMTAGSNASAEILLVDTSFHDLVLVGYADGRVRRHAFADFDMPVPDMWSPDPFLGDDAVHEALQAVWGE